MITTTLGIGDYLKTTEDELLFSWVPVEYRHSYTVCT